MKFLIDRMDVKDTKTKDTKGTTGFLLPIREIVSSIFIYLPFKQLVQLRKLSRQVYSHIAKLFISNWHIYKDISHQTHIYFLSLNTVYDLYTFAKISNIPLKDFCIFACQYNRKDILDILLIDHPTLFSEDDTLVTTTINSGHLSLLQWLNNDSTTSGSGIFHPWVPDHINRAARYGYLDIVRYLRTASKVGGVCHWTAETCEMAAMSGNLALLKWLRENKTFNGGVCPWGVTTMRAAASYGHLDIIKWLRNPALHTPYWKNTNLDCSFNGHNFSLKWKSETSLCPWTNSEVRFSDTGELIFLPKHSTIHDLKYREDDYKCIPVSDFVCPWDEECAETALRRGHFATFKWLIRSGCPWNKHNVLSFLVNNSKCMEMMWLFRQHEFSCDFWPKIKDQETGNEEKKVNTKNTKNSQRLIRTEDVQLDVYLFDRLTQGNNPSMI